MKVEIKLPTDLPLLSVEKLLSDEWHVPRKVRYFLRLKKHVWINGETIDFDQPVSGGARVTVQIDDSDVPKLSVALGAASLADIVYEDEQLVIAHKPFGMKTHGNKKGELALQNHVAAVVGMPVYVVHRLDVETSGLVLFAKDQFVLPILSTMLERREIHRIYEAVIAGQLTTDRTIAKAIGRDRHDKRRRLISATGKPAVTHVKVLSALTASTRVECQLETGRTHQIRVHLASIGHPIIGDPLYGRAAVARDKLSPGRLLLHAKKLTLRQPFTREMIEVSVKSPSFEGAIAKLS